MRIASHGLAHRPWRGLGATELAAELEGSRRLLEAAAGRPVTHAACPFGSYDRRVLHALREAGYERVFTSDGGRRGARAGSRPGRRCAETTTTPRSSGSSRDSPGPGARREKRTTGR